MARRVRIAVCVVVLGAFAFGCRPGVGDDAGVSVSGADRIEVREVVPGGWPPEWREREDADVRGEGPLRGVITDQEEVARLVGALDGARYIDLGRVDYDLPEPDLEVVFMDGETVLDRLGYYERVSSWGSYEVDGRWFRGWDPLAEIAELPRDVTDGDAVDP